MRLTVDCKPPERQRVLLWRDDSRTWEIGTVAYRWLGHPEYAYTHWLPLPEEPSR